jgi:hypothetical protein
MQVRLVSLIVFLLSSLVQAGLLEKAVQPQERLPQAVTGRPWARHTIDAGSRGADGVRVADLNSDGLPDLVTGWEEGGEVWVYLNPGVERSSHLWPKVMVGQVASPEDAVFVDVNGDEILDVVSSCEGREKTVYAHLAHADAGERLSGDQWTTAAFPATQREAWWMFCLPLEVDGKHGVDLVLGAKGRGAQVGWLESPADSTKLENWLWHPLVDVGWIMSLRHRDVDGDEDQDIIFSDRRGTERGIWWLENPGVADALGDPWPKHAIAGQDREVMFLDMGDLDGDGLEDMVCAAKQDDVVFAKRLATLSPRWEEEVIPMPTGVGTGKGVAIGDLDADQAVDLVVSCENARGTIGVFWLRKSENDHWIAKDISGAAEGIKFDRIELLDLDGDMDLDVVTCEETDNLGVIWYENPAFERW